MRPPQPSHALQRLLAIGSAGLLGLALLLPLSAAHAQRDDEVLRREWMAPLPVPRDMPVELIATDMRMNGSPMQISRLEVEKTQPVVDFYRDYFSRRGERGVMSDVVFEGRRLLSGMVDRRLITVELLPESKGYSVLVSSLVPERVQAPEKLAKDMPRMPYTDVLQVIESIEETGGHVTTSMRNRHSLESNGYYLRAQLLLRGWERVRDDSVDVAEHRQISFVKAGRQMRVDLRRQADATFIVFNETH